MTARLLRLFIVLMMCFVAACTSLSGSDEDRATEPIATPSTTESVDGSVNPTSSTTAPPLPGETDETDESDESVLPLIEPTDEPLGGLLAVVREGGGLDLVRPNGSVVDVLVSDGNGPALQPTWAPDGQQLAWVSAGENGVPAVGLADREGNISATIDVPFAPFFLAWSPDGRWIAALGNSRGEVGLAYIDIEAERSTPAVATAQGLYLAWDPDSSGTVIHAGTEWGYLSPPAGGSSFGFLEAAFAAPVWIDEPSRAIVPTGSPGSFALSQHGDVPAGGGAPDPSTAEQIATFDGRIWIVADPTSRRLAVMTTEDDSPVIGGGSSLQVSLPRLSAAAEQAAPPELAAGLSVLDLATGTVELVAEPDDLTAGFFWDPTGELLLRLAVSPAGGDGPLRWVVRANDGASVTLGDFIPTDVFGGSYLPFFDQYAQSISLFSPTGRAFAYAATDGDSGSASIQVVDLAMASPEPRRLTDGVLAVWSPE